MGYLCSKYSELSNLRFRKFPTRPLNNLRTVRVGYTLVGVSTSGTVYTNSRIADRGCWSESAAGQHFNDLIDALFRLGVINEEVRDGHITRCMQIRAKQEARFVLRHDLPRLEKRYGLKLTAAQKRKIEKVQDMGVTG